LFMKGLPFLAKLLSIPFYDFIAVAQWQPASTGNPSGSHRSGTRLWSAPDLRSLA
jgi:hypothetical protein